MDKKDSIVFYCKDCGGMFFATCEDPVSKESAKDIAEYLQMGHRLEKVSAATVRKEWGDSKCAECNWQERHKKNMEIKACRL